MRRAGFRVAGALLLAQAAAVAEQKGTRDCGVFREQAVDARAQARPDALRKIARAKLRRREAGVFNLSGSVAAHAVQAKVVGKVELSGVGRAPDAPDVRSAADLLPELNRLQLFTIAAKVEPQAAAYGLSVQLDFVQCADGSFLIAVPDRSLCNPSGQGRAALRRKGSKGRPLTEKAQRAQR